MLIDHKGKEEKLCLAASLFACHLRQQEQQLQQTETRNEEKKRVQEMPKNGSVKEKESKWRDRQDKKNEKKT